MRATLTIYTQNRTFAVDAGSIISYWWCPSYGACALSGMLCGCGLLIQVQVSDDDTISIGCCTVINTGGRRGSCAMGIA